MLPTRCEKFYTPPSSPVSLSGSFTNLSSPPSSPNVALLDDSDNHPPLTRVIDPFAGSYRAKRLSGTPPQDSPNKKPRRSCHQLFLEAEFIPANSDACSFASPVDQDASIWEEAVEKVFNTGIRSIDLS
jgi:hypothetical protein